MQSGQTEKDKLYIRLTNAFLDKIRTGEWRPGGQIPTEEELCKSFDVSKITVRRAVTNLVFEGYLEKFQGKGTFVKQGPHRSGISMKTTLIEGVFLPGSHGNITVVEKGIVNGLDEDLLKRMGPVLDMNVYRLARLKHAAGVPVLLNETYIPVRMCPSVVDWEPEGSSVFEYLRDNGTTDVVKVVQTVEIAKPRQGAASALNSRPTTPCLIIHRVFLSQGDVTVAYSRTTARGDRFELVTEFERMK